MLLNISGFLLLAGANLYLLFPIVFFVALFVYEVSSGKAFDLRWGRVVVKKDRPVGFWGMVGIQAAFIVFLVYKLLS
jgi:hypothetical protein